MNIITFGSCLSRRTAERYKNAFNAKIVSSVYHNRSDIFLDRFVGDSNKPLDANSLARKYEIDDADQMALLTNQSPDGIGKHLLPDGNQLFDALGRDDISLILVDNFMDVASTAWHDPSSGDSFFATSPKLKSNSSLQKLPYLTPDAAAVNTRRIVSEFKARQPNTPIVFLHFPFSTYVGDQRREVWGKDFAKQLRLGIPEIPPIFIPMAMRGDEPSHFSEQMYFAYAGMVRAIISGYNL